VGILFLIAFFVVSLFIVGLVLLQEGKGGGLTGMSTGMDGVMGAKNPLRRMTSYLFIIFVVMCLAINMYFHSREDTSLPAGIPMTPRTTVAIPEAAGETVPEGALRPEAGATESAATEAPAAPAPAAEAEAEAEAPAPAAPQEAAPAE
jgi:protein translocase SecG subunit